MSASQNKKKTLSLGLALIPVISMLLLLIIGYGIMGLRIEPLLLCSAAVAAGIAWWQGYCWEDIINSVVDKLAKAMPVIIRRCEFLIFSFPILRFASDSCLVWTLMGWTSLTPSPFRRRLSHGMKADSGWIRYWITWRKTAAGLLNRRQSTFPGQELSRRREPIYYGWIVKNWDWMTNS